MKATVYVTRRPDIADPQGAAVLRGVRELGYASVHSVRIDKVIAMEVDATDTQQALSDVEALCQKLLANPVMEDYRIVLQEEDGSTA
ncbi:MAG: phosphoribosylformylglycinamidine synthase subunit PurS [Acidimicrobiia bacterium]|nr:phosphoribosylformylglycinamidine synthase subunit PurS [Acidimicrobiia bacterium]